MKKIEKIIKDKDQCPKCGKTQEAVFRRGGRAVAVLFSCGHGFDLETNKEIK